MMLPLAVWNTGKLQSTVNEFPDLKHVSPGHSHVMAVKQKNDSTLSIGTYWVHILVPGPTQSDLLCTQYILSALL